MQDRIAKQEQKLFRIDKDAERDANKLGTSRSLRSKTPENLSEKILDDLAPLLQQYSKSYNSLTLMKLTIYTR